MKQQIERLISEGKTEQAIRLLLEYTQDLPDPDLHKEVTHHSAVFARFSKNQRMDTESSADLNIAYAKINRALLGVLSQLPEESPKKKGAKPNNFLKIGLLVLLGLLLLGVFYVWLSADKESYTCNGTPCIDCLDCYKRGCFEEAHDCFTAKRKLGEGDRAKVEVSSTILDADKYMVDGLFDKALAYYLKAIELDQEVEIHRKKAIEGLQFLETGAAMMERGEYSEAKAAYNEAVKLSELLSPHAMGMIRKIEELEKEQPGARLKKLFDGTWGQYKSGKQGEIIGSLSFDFSNNGGEPKVSYQNHYVNKIIHQGELTDLVVLAGKSAIQGIWHNFDTDKKGAFYFELDTSGEAFTGKYSLSPTASPRYYWKGTKK